MQNKTVIHLLEAESELYRSNAKIVRNTDFSNGEAVKLGGNGKAWQVIKIIKNGTYKLALKGLEILRSHLVTLSGLIQTH